MAFPALPPDAGSDLFPVGDRDTITWKRFTSEGEAMTIPSRRNFLRGACGFFLSIMPNSGAFPAHREQSFIHMMNYVTEDDFALMNKMHINTVLVELKNDAESWRTTYDAAIKHDLAIVPLIWGHDQSIWEWNELAKEWELDDRKYPMSVGARFLRFLRENPRYFQQTLAIYSFHEPLAQPEKTGPQRLKKFYQQIHEEIFTGQNVQVYGEDMTFVWPQADECLTGVLDYEIHTVYPFVNSPRGRYRPFLPEGHYGEPTSDLHKVLDLQRQTIELQLKRIQEAKAAANGRKPRLILILQTFVDADQEDLWNRMPDAEEMETVASYLLEHFRERIAGIA